MITHSADFTEKAFAGRLSRLDLEGDLFNLAQMARMAQEAVYEAIGETKIREEEIVSHTLTSANITRAIFVVGQVEDMIEALQKKLDL